MRHAKSSWKSDAPTDHGRPLNKRGRKAAPKVGAELAARGWVPEVVLSSDSTRTRETFARMKGALRFEGEAEFLSSLYHGGVDEAVDAVLSLSNKVRGALLLGHNPGWEEVVEHFAGQSVVMKTGCAALLRGKGPWSALTEPHAWTLEDVIYPRSL